ncbi:MAG: DUF2325 domain-containing protein [Thioalkalivibrio sp.]|nr:DUF2325 domain-containing protein [Thioalkalivibrio sp.]
MCDGHDHKAGGCLTAKNLLAVHPTDEQVLQTPILPRKQPAHAQPPRLTGKLRPKLWDLPPALHCPVIGTCLEVHALRRMVRSLGHDAGRLSDYEVHVTFVAAASGKNAFSLAAQKALDRTHAAHLRRFARARTIEQLAALWQQSLEEGDVPGGFWATLTHPRCDSALRDRAREEIHMLSHQIGAGQRADLKRLTEALAELKALRLQMETNQARTRQTVEDRERRIAELGSALDASERQHHESVTELQRLRQRIDTLGGATAFDQLLKIEERARTAEHRQQALQAELADWRQACATAREQNAALEAECQRWQAEYSALEQLLARPTGGCNACDNRLDGVCPDLCGRRILCVGGRSQLIDHYRDLVAHCNGRFDHYDGGIEDSRQRLETMLASADAVVCTTDCVSHDAYYRSKRFCKRFAKPCVLLRSSGVTTFARALEAVAV